MNSVNRLLPLLLATVLLGGCSILPDSWTESDNQVPPAELTDLTPAIQVDTLWSLDTGAGTDEQRLELAPAVFRGRVVSADRDGHVESLDAATGKPVWSVETEAPISGGPGVGDGLVLLGTSDAEVIALEEESGQELWRSRVSSEVLSIPRIRQEMVVVHSIDGKLYGLNAGSGEQAWIYDRTVPVLTLRGSSSPVIDGTRVITGFPNGKLVSLDLFSGNPNWETTVTPPRGRSELERIADIDADPVVTSGVVFVCTYQGDLAAVAEDSGVVLWRRKLSSYAGLNADWRQIYVTDSTDTVWAVDPRNGAALWKQDKLLNRRLTAPTVLDDYVLVGDFEGYVHWLSYEDGRLLARTRISSAPINAAPRVEDGIAYVYADDGVVSALRPGDLLLEP